MKVIERKASDNKYLHRDFHISMNMLMEYISKEYGPTALTEYLQQFSREFHSKRKESLQNGDLESLERYFEDVYKKEEWPILIKMKNDRLILSQESCPGISYLLKNGHKPVEQYMETYTTVYKTLCQDTPYEYVMESYDSDTGRCKQLFQRRSL